MFRFHMEAENGDAYGVGHLRSMRVVCYSLRVNRKRNVVLLVKLKDAPGVVDWDRVLAKNGIYYECGRLTSGERSGRLATGTMMS